MGVRRGCDPAPSLFNTCMNWILGRVVDKGHCEVYIGNTKITDLVFADDAVIFIESLDFLAKALGAQVSWPKTKVQVFGELLGETVQSIHVCDEDIYILDSFK